MKDSRIAADDVVDLEPLAAGGDDADWLDVREEGPASTPLRWRLTVVAGFLALFHLAFAAIKFAGPAAGTGFTSDVPAWSLLVRATVALAAVALLRSATPLGMRRLRWVEWTLLLVEMSFILALQYLSVVDLIDRRDLIDAVAIQKNGVIRTLVLMICFGVFLPRAPASTARISVTMAAVIIFCHAVVLHHADTVGLDIDDVAGHQIVMANAIFLIMGVVLATLAAWVVGDEDQRGRPDGLGRVGPYRLLRPLDTGGTGRVYAAQHDELGRPCAIKFVRPGDDDASARFEREVQAAARLSHPNTVTVFDCGRTGDGTAYCAMEFLPGLCVADVVGRSGPLPAGRAVYLGRQICGALTEAHRLGFVHGDLSPANVFVAVLGGRCDVVKVLDFGAVGGSALPERDPATADTVAGTPEYAAPEQVVVGRGVDGRADIYGLGALLYFMITGGPPFVRATPVEVLRGQVSEPVTPPREREPTVPGDLEAVILRCLSKRPEDRYPDARAVAAALGACGCSGEWNEDHAEAWWLKQSSA